MNNNSRFSSLSTAVGFSLLFAGTVTESFGAEHTWNFGTAGSANSLTSPVVIAAGASLSVPMIGNVSWNSPLGKSSSITLGGSSTSEQLTHAVVTEPTNAAAAAAKKEAYNAAVDRKYRTWKATLSSERQQWEGVLEANLGSFYFPHHMQDKLKGVATAWDFVEEVPGLPRILLIGDSISRGYTLAVRKTLAGKANVHRAPANCGPTATGLAKLPIWLEGGPWDVIHFNFGIHDRGTKEAVYAENLEKLVGQLKATGAKLIWARTTPTIDASNAEKFSPERCSQLNTIADEVMKRHLIVANDLCTFIQPRLAELQLPSNVHFSEHGYDVLGGKVAAEILGVLSSGKQAVEPN